MAAARACTPSGRTVPARYPVQPSRKLPIPVRLFHPIARAVFALYEPDCFVCCRGALTLREAGVDVRVYPGLAGGVWEANAHLKR